MGSWNGTCMVSNLPIKYGDKVVAIIIKKNKLAEEDKLNGFVYSTDEWQPISAPIIGEYNDYGSIENIEDIHNTYEHINKLQFDIKEYHDTKYINDLKSFFDCVERGLVSYKNEKIGFVLIHVKLFTVMCETQKKLKYEHFKYFLSREFGLFLNDDMLKNIKHS